MKRVSTIFFSLVFAGGIALLGLGISRHRLPYEEGRYFDPATATVYHVQAAEFYTGLGVFFCLLSLGFLGWRRWRSRRCAGQDQESA